MDIAAARDTAKNGVRIGGADRPGVARFDKLAEADGSPQDPTFDQVEGNSENSGGDVRKRGW